jgi:uncharacterized membrane protein
MSELEPTWGRVLSVWWLFVWRAGVGSLVMGFVAGFIFGFVGALLGAPKGAISIGSGLLGFVIAIVWGIIVMRMALEKKYGEFRIALVSHQERRDPGL